jgi:TonB family protein
MDSSKSSFFALYNRALRTNPGMQGEVIFRISILASGRVSKVSIVSSGLNDNKLERKLMARIRLINFGKMSVETWTDNYRMTFLPS